MIYRLKIKIQQNFNQKKLEVNETFQLVPEFCE